MIDLHLHTTASDGRSSPESLVEEARRAGVRVMAVTDHDTMAAWPAASAAAEAAGIACVAGIEITAVERGRDVHILGYFQDLDDAELSSFLATQRADRVRRLEAMVDRLATLGLDIDLPPLVGGAPGRAVGRPLVAAALVAAGHVASIGEAFDRYLSPGRPAFVARAGASPEAVVGILGRANGIASLAHPGKMGDDRLVARLIDAGLPAIEVYHPDHTPEDRARYLGMARAAGLAVTGGSDYHGPGSGRSTALGQVSLPADEFDQLRRLAAGRRAPA